MLYFCADDYGIAKESNIRIKECIEKGTLNKVSVLPNGDLSGLKEHILSANVTATLHLNLVEGYALSDAKDVNLLVTDSGQFKYSFIGLFLLSISSKRKILEKQLYKEIKAQIDFWKSQVGADTPLFIDSHQHTHMIPLIFKTLMKVIKQEELNVRYLRIPSEPVIPYLLAPSLYFTYGLSGIIKQWLLKFFNLINKKSFKKSKIKTAYFIGLMFSGKVTVEKIEKVLPHYLKIANKRGSDIEITLHPGFLEEQEDSISGTRSGFKKFYYSPWRKKEYDTAMNFRY